MVYHNLLVYLGFREDRLQVGQFADNNVLNQYYFETKDNWELMSSAYDNQRYFQPKHLFLANHYFATILEEVTSHLFNSLNAAFTSNVTLNC